MQNYSLGFVFDHAQERVLMLQKRARDKFNPGCWNGIGGHVEPGESFELAVSRECLEEADLDIPPSEWVQVGTLTDNEHYFLAMFVACADIDSARTMTDEPVRVFTKAEIEALPSSQLASGIQTTLASWLRGHLDLSKALKTNTTPVSAPRP